ncbi:hypothetical protein [Novosphingobium rosa]|uniref:hypothetical protein n=1 Tax=Novosphingobium rosa TaxID=76978 RepID=UPI0008359389|nr:hypothetical protein [Novosphingobium rosa]
MQAYILRETIISMIINAAFSLAFFLAVFGHGAAVPVWGIGAYAFDALPQSIAIAAMSTLVPGAIALKKRRSGALRVAPQARTSQPFLPHNLWLRAAVLALLSAVLGGLFNSVALLVLGLAQLPWWPALIAKLAYGAALAGIVTPIALRAALRG